MRHSKMTKAMALILSLVMITSVFVGNTLSRYVTSVSSTDSARVAVWGINGEETQMNLFDTKYIVDGKTIAEANNKTDKIIAPGTKGEAEFNIINFEQDVAPEVAYEVSINLDDSEINDLIKNNPSIQWKLDNGSFGTWDQLKTSILSLSGNETGTHTYGPGEFATAFHDTQTHKISWQWVMDNNNIEMDTQMGNLAVENSIEAVIKVGITAIQIGKEIENNTNLSTLIYDGSINEFTNEYYMSETGPISSQGNAYTEEISVIPGETIYLTFKHETKSKDVTFYLCNNVGAYHGYDENGNHIAMLKRDAFTQVNDGINQIMKTVIPENVTKIIVNGTANAFPYLVIYRDSYVEDFSSYKSKISVNNNLFKNTIVSFGDSITQGYTADDKSYIYHISKANNMIVNNFARAGYKSMDILETIQNNSNILFNLTPNDFVIIGGFVNDPSKDVPLGEITPVGTTEFDTTTSIGTIEQIFYNYVNNPDYKAKIGVVLTPQPTGNESYRDKPEYWSAWISVLEKYNIPYLNLYDMEIYYTDGVHPSHDGQHQMAEVIEVWMNEL